MEEKSKGGTYNYWLQTILPEYTQIIKTAIKKLLELPTSEFYIPEGDVHDMKMLAALFDVQLPDDDELYDMNTFKYYLGILYKKAKDMVLKDLRPTNPLEDKLTELFADNEDLGEEI